MIDSSSSQQISRSNEVSPVKKQLKESKNQLFLSFENHNLQGKCCALTHELEALTSVGRRINAIILFKPFVFRNCPAKISNQDAKNQSKTVETQIKTKLDRNQHCMRSTHKASIF